MRQVPGAWRHTSRRFLVWTFASGVVGALTGLLVAGFQTVVLEGVWARTARHPWVAVAAPAIALALVWVVLRATRSPGSDTAEDYVRSFHERRSRLRLRDLWGRLAAGVLTIGLGGSMGLEGPSLLIGGSIGESIQHRFRRLFSRDDAKTLLVAGGAAGISAVFKAPLTGLVFAMEVPFADDIARDVLGPALVSSAAGYLVEVSLRGTAPLIPIVGHPSFDLSQLGLALVLGLVAGLAGRVVVRTYHASKRLTHDLPAPVRIVLCGAVVSAMGAVAMRVFDAPLVLGPGEEAITRAALGHLAWTSLLLLFVLKMVATSATAAGGGVGGLFFPLVVMGTTLGASFGSLLGAHGTLYPLVGMASLLGAAYHTPLAGVSFVAEATGRAGFVVPTFIATAAAFATIGADSMSRRQRPRRVGRLEQLLDVDVAEVMVDAEPLSPDAPATDVIERTLRHRRNTFSVVDGDGSYAGVVDVDSVLAIEAAERQTCRVRDVMRTDHPTASASMRLRAAASMMSAAGVDYLPVVDESGHLRGCLLSSEIFRLGEVVDRIAGDDEPI